MKNIKKFENYNTKSVQEQIDEILDNLSKKGELSISEREFMDDASNGKVKEISIPKTTGNFWADMANPHNIGIMWNNGKIWKQIKTVDDEKMEKMSSDEQWEFKRNKKAKNIADKLNNQDFINLLISLKTAKDSVDSLVEKDKSFDPHWYLRDHISNAIANILNNYGHDGNIFDDENGRGLIVDGKKYPLID